MKAATIHRAEIYERLWKIEETLAILGAEQKDLILDRTRLRRELDPHYGRFSQREWPS